MGGWSLRRLVTMALLVSYGLVAPLAAIVFYRLDQVKNQPPRWAALAEASRRLSQARVCSGATSGELAHRDLAQWRSALLELDSDRAGWLGVTPLVSRVEALQKEVAGALEMPESDLAPWVSAHCDEVRGVAALSLDKALELGLHPTSRADHYGDLAVRDVTVYLALWLAAAVLLLLWSRRRAAYPAVKMGNLLARVAEGDLAVKIPESAGGETQRVAAAIRAALGRFEELDRIKSERVGELRSLVQRLVDLVEQPVLVIGADEKIHYANEAAGRAVGEKAASLGGQRISNLPGGAALADLVRGALESGEGRIDQLLETDPLGRERHVARCALVRDNRGQTRRVIVVLKSEEGPWWRRLWRGAEAET